MYHIVKAPLGDYVRPIDEPSKAIPMDPANTDYQRYLAWLADGNEPEIIEG